MDTFPFKSLALELRMLIYPHMDLQLQHDKNAPVAVLAFAADPQLYSEILPFYKTCNAIVRMKDQEAFKKLKMKELLKIKHLRISYEVPADVCAELAGMQYESERLLRIGDENIELRANKCFLRNAFETLTFDLSASRVYPTAFMPTRSWRLLMSNVMPASKVGVSKVIVKHGARTPPRYYKQADFDERWSCEKSVEDGEEKVIYTWQTESAGGLELPGRGMNRAQDTGTIQREERRSQQAVPARSRSITRRPI